MMFKDSDSHSDWPKVANTVIEAGPGLSGMIIAGGSAPDGRERNAMRINRAMKHVFMVFFLELALLGGLEAQEASYTCRTHGYQTLEDNTEVVYDTSQFYAPQHAIGVLYNDLAFGIEWPLPVAVISEAYRNWPRYPSA
jgi:dTDP-4-dehydrorhamnose 3,5-epimerase